jgi:DNA invertase Pin-like site-specific DNA recombinase
MDFIPMENQPMPMTAVYMRCSSTTQTTNSQRFELQQYLSAQVICGTVEWFEDAAITGTHLDRPALGRLHRHIIDGDVDTVVLWKLDRLSRSVVDGIKLLADWTERNVRIVVVTQKIDLSGPVGRMVASLLLGVAEMEREGLRERQAAGISAARAKGVKFGRPKKINPSLIRRLKSEGNSVRNIAKHLQIARQSVYNVLNADNAKSPKSLIC